MGRESGARLAHILQEIRRMSGSAGRSPVTASPMAVRRARARRLHRVACRIKCLRPEDFRHAWQVMLRDRDRAVSAVPSRALALRTQMNGGTS